MFNLHLLAPRDSVPFNIIKNQHAQNKTAILLMYKQFMCRAILFMYNLHNEASHETKQFKVYQDLHLSVLKALQTEDSNYQTLNHASSPQ
jgi:hypothetical protein